MKKLLIIISFTMLCAGLFNCSKDNSPAQSVVGDGNQVQDGPLGDPQNTWPRDDPSGDFPVEIPITLRWSCYSEDNNPIFYDVYLGVTFTNTTRIAEHLNVASYTLENLTSNTHYYWWVAAHDTDGNDSKGDLWEFYTQ